MSPELLEHPQGELLEEGAKIEGRVSPAEILSIKKRLGATDKQMQVALTMSSATYKRRFERDELLSLQETESVFRLRDRLALAEQILGEEDAQEWFLEPHPHLDGRSPLSACRTEPSGRAVENMLLAIEFGNLA